MILGAGRDLVAAGHLRYLKPPARVLVLLEELFHLLLDALPRGIRQGLQKILQGKRLFGRIEKRLDAGSYLLGWKLTGRGLGRRFFSGGRFEVFGHSVRPPSVVSGGRSLVSVAGGIVSSGRET